MKPKAALVAALLLSLALALPSAQAAKAKSKAKSADDLETLEEYMADLRKNPGKEAQRIKIINLVLEMKRPPAMPEEAKRFLARGTAAVEGAKNEADFKEAVAEFQKAANAAPWWANAYYNLGVAQDKAGQVAAAAKSLKLYLLAAPEARDAEKVQQLIHKMEFRQEKAGKGFSPDTDFKAWLARLNGSRWRVNEDAEAKSWIELEGDTLTEVLYMKTTSSVLPGEKIKQWSVKLEKRSFVIKRDHDEARYEISADGEVIVSKVLWSKYPGVILGKEWRCPREK